MSGPESRFDPTRPYHREPEYGTASPADVPTFLGIMRILHDAPTVGSFNRLLAHELEPSDTIPLAHLFEEICTLAIHRLISEDLLFDAFGIDDYWTQLEPGIRRLRDSTGNPKLCENFEICAQAARVYREYRPRKPRLDPRAFGHAAT
jgi:hypothetical protein